MRFLILAILLAPAIALAHPPPPPPEEVAYEPHRPVVEWSTWVRLAYGVSHVRSDAVAQSTDPTMAPPLEKGRTFDAALGFELSLPLTRAGNLRIGPWYEFRGFSEHPVAGGEIVLTAVPSSIDLFLYKGQGILALRGGGNDQEVTGSIAYGLSRAVGSVSRARRRSISLHDRRAARRERDARARRSACVVGHRRHRGRAVRRDPLPARHS